MGAAKHNLCQKWEVSIHSSAAGSPSLFCVPKLGGHSPGVSQGLTAQALDQLPLPRGTNVDKEVSLIHFSFLFLISFIAPGEREVTAEGSCWQQPEGFEALTSGERLQGLNL